MEHSIQHLAAQLKSARQHKGLSQRALSLKVGIPQSHISKIEHGMIDLQASSLIEIARALDLELMLVPKGLVPTVNALQQGSESEQQPMYRLEEEMDNV